MNKYRYNYGAVLKVTRNDTKETLERNLRLMKDGGLNTVVIWPAAFWWEEKKEGYPFNTGREILKIAESVGIDVIMELAGQLTVMEYIPDFMMKPEYVPVDRDGNAIRFQGAFGFLNYFHPEVRELICEHYKNAARAYKDYPALIGYDVFNETMFSSFDEYTMEDYRAWLRDKYGSIDRLNAVWERTYSDFSQIKYERWKWMSIMPEVDFCIWRRESVARFMKPWCDAIREIDTEHALIADNIHSQVSPKAAYARPQGDYSLKTVVDTIGMSFYPKQPNGTNEPALRWEILDGFASAANREGFYISEMQTHIQALFNAKSCVLPSELRAWCLESYAAGAKGLIYWMWRPFDKGLQTLGRGLVNYRGLPTERYELAKELGGIFEKYGRVSPTRPSFGVLYHEPSDDLSRGLTNNYTGAGIDENAVIRSIFGAYKALYTLNMKGDIVTIDEINDYSAIILSNICAISREDCKKLMDYVKRGGILVLDGKNAVIDELSQAYDVIPGGGLDELAGEIYFETDDRDSSFELGGKTVFGFGGRDIPECCNAECVASFSDGVPAIIKKKYGKGVTYTVNSQIFYGFEKNGGEAALELLKLLNKEHSLSQLEAESEIKYRLAEADGKTLLFAFNYTDKPLADEVKVKLGENTSAVSVSLGAYGSAIYEV